MTTTTIYMPLLNEGTPVWRPVETIQIGKDTYKIPTDTVISDDEVWQFQPGTIVKCRIETFSEGYGLVAYEAV
jgi:hypothetical protein